jgi:PAS domain S-box-containing protein
MTAASRYGTRSEDFASLVNLANDAIIIIDLGSTIEFWNRGAERLYGWTAEEALGKHAHDLLKTEFPIPLEDVKYAVRRYGEWSSDLVHRTRDNKRVIVASRWTPRHSEDGELIGTFEINRDVTEQRARAEALGRAQSAERLATLGRLAASIVHDLVNPLESVSSVLNLLVSGQLSDKSTKELVAAAQEELQHAFAVIHNTLDMARPSRDLQHLKLASIIDQALAVQTTRLQSHNVVIVKRYTTEGLLLCRASEIRQTITNLIGNAIDAMKSKRGGTVRIHLHQIGTVDGGPAYRVTIADEGTGIASEVQGRMFTPFVSTKGELGTGLGLWIVRGIVEKYGGHIRYRTRNDGKHQGTCFSFTLASRRESE